MSPMPLSPDALAGLIAQNLVDLRRLAPEAVLAGTVVALLLARTVTRRPLGAVALAGSLTALAALFAPLLGLWPASDPGPAFTGLLQLDALAGYVRGVVLLATLLVVLLMLLTGEPAGDAADLFTLVLGAALGLCLMASANHLLMVFLAVEMASLPSYVLAGLRRGERAGGEAALKYMVYGAAASGVMLYGLTLLVSTFGTAHLPELAPKLAAVSDGWPLPVAAGAALVGVGLAFKLAAVPAHVWLPDVFDGASAEVGAFLSVASKAAAVGLAIRLLQMVPGDRSVGLVLAVAAALTATWGNLAALTQTDLRRLLGYSTVAHAGYLLMGLACLTPAGTSASLFYLAAYLLMNLLAFAGAAALRKHAGGDTLAHCRGLAGRSPTVAVCVGLGLLSLLGLPPLAGFAGKFQLFAAVYEAGYGWLLAVGLANTVLSAGYYLRVLRAMTLDEPTAVDEKGHPLPLGEGAGLRLYLLGLAVMLVVTGVFWGPLAELARP
jgi:NADH-quinone oxidoreductase subunit N